MEKRMSLKELIDKIITDSQAAQTDLDQMANDTTALAVLMANLTTEDVAAKLLAHKPEKLTPTQWLALIEQLMAIIFGFITPTPVTP